MIDTFPPIALSHLIPDQSCHHTTDPLFADDGILCSFEGLVVVVVDAVEGRRDCWLAREKVLGFGNRHFIEILEDLRSASRNGNVWSINQLGLTRGRFELGGEV